MTIWFEHFLSYVLLLLGFLLFFSSLLGKSEIVPFFAAAVQRGQKGSLKKYVCATCMAEKKKSQSMVVERSVSSALFYLWAAESRNFPSTIPFLWWPRTFTLPFVVWADMSLWPFISEQPIPMAKADLVCKKKKGNKKESFGFWLCCKKKKNL